MGGDGSSVVLSNSNPLPISDAGGSITVDGSVTVTGGVTITGTVAVTDNSGSITVDDGATTLSVDDGAGSLTVDGTVTANAGSGTFAVSAASLPLPSGASTSAKQPALGVAGTASTDVITVQGIASGVAQPVSLKDGSGNSLTSKAAGGERAISVAIIDGSGAQVTAFGGAGGTSMTDDAAFTVGSTAVTPIAGTYKSVRDAVDDNDGGAFAMTAKRAQYVSLETPNADSAMDETNDAVKVSIVADSVGSTLDTEDGTIVTGQANVALVASMGYEYDGTNWTRPRGAHTVAHDAVDAGNPVKIGGFAITALPTAVSNADRANVIVDKFGRQVMVHGTVRDLVGTQTTTISASTSETTIVTAGASVFNDIVMLIVSNTSSATNTRIDFRDTTGGTVLFSLFSVGGSTPVGFSLSRPIPQTTVNTNWTAQCATSTTDVRVYVVYEKNK